MKKEIILILFITAIVFVSGCTGSNDDTDDSDNSESGSQDSNSYANENWGSSDVDAEDLSPPALPNWEWKK